MWQVRQLQHQWSLSGVASFPEGCDARVVAGLLVVFLHELPESVISGDVYDCYIAVQDIADSSAKVRNLRHLYQNLAVVNRAVLLRIVTMLRRFADQGPPLALALGDTWWGLQGRRSAIWPRFSGLCCCAPL